MRPVHLPIPFLLFVVLGCSAPERRPLAPDELMTSLREQRELLLEVGPYAPETTPDSEGGAEAGARVLPLDQAMTLAVVHNPDLQRLRSLVGVAEARLVEAGLLPDPSFGWDAMDWVVGGTRDDAVTGLSAFLPLLRPGERSARLALSEADLEGVRARVAEAEWRVAGEVQDAWLLAWSLERRLATARELEGIAARTAAAVEQGRALGGATALEVEAALLEAGQARALVYELEREAERARLRLCSLLGLPPDTAFRLPDPPALVLDGAAVEQPAALVDRALASRPDVQVAMTDYRRAEEALQLVAAGRWPSLTIGTGFEVTLPILSRFAGPAMRTAEARRRSVALALVATLASLRVQARDVVAELAAARRTWELNRDVLTPAALRALEAGGRALELGGATVLEILVVQRRALEARLQAEESHERLLRAEARLRWFLGRTSESALVPLSAQD